MRPIDAETLKNRILQIYPMDIGGEAVQKAVIRIVDDAPTIGGWISVKDGLPNKGQIVIASDGEHTWDVGMYKSFFGKPSEWNWKKNTIKTVLWWMPKDGALPEPPKEVNNG